jgi:hypothetical protein
VLAATALLAACNASTTASRAHVTTERTTAGVSPARLSPVPPPGTVTVVPGPFDDRFRLSGTSLTGRDVRLHLAVTSDVSELIDLEVTAAFYGADGRLLGTGRTTYAEGDGSAGKPAAENGGTALVVHLPGTVGAPVSARVSVPVLVNE